MNNTKFVFDSNVFINMQRHHPQDVFGSLWLKISEAFEKGMVISSAEVLDELRVGDDALVVWANQRKFAFIRSGYEIQNLVRSILLRFPDLVTGSRKSNSADPFVIALAKHRNCILVSDETMAGNGQPVKIPNVCIAYDVKQIKYIDFLRALNIYI